MNSIRTLFLFVVLGFVTPTSAGWVYYTPDAVDGMDTWYGDTYYTGGMPNDPSLKVGGWFDIYASGLRFNLSGLPVSAAEARIYLYAFPSSGTPAALKWWRPNANWQEATASLAKPIDQTFYLGSTTVPPTSGWSYTNVTSLYNAWRTGSSVYLNFGLKITPTATNNNFSTFYSSDYTGNVSLRPTLCVKSTSTESRIVLKWPLSTPKPASPTPGGAFGDPWGPGITKCVGLPMTHAGVDIPNTVDKPVYAAEDGFVREVLPASQTGGWASAIVIGHNHPNRSGKYTTVYWHVNPLAGVVGSSTILNPPIFVPKGTQIATIADISTRARSHLHIGVRIGAYNTLTSDKGALPTNYCSELPTFKENFVNPWDASQVLFQ